MLPTGANQLILPPAAAQKQQRDYLAMLLMGQGASKEPIRSPVELIGRLASMGVGAYRQQQKDSGKDPSLINALLGRDGAATGGTPGGVPGGTPGIVPPGGTSGGASGGSPDTTTAAGLGRSMMTQGQQFMAAGKQSGDRDLWNRGLQMYTQGQKLMVEKELRKSGAANVSVNNRILAGKEQTEYSKQAGKNTANEIATYRTAANDARSTLARVNKLDALLKRFPNQGALASSRVTVGALAKSLGIDTNVSGLKPDEVATGQAIRAMTMELVNKIAASQKGPQTDEDVRRFQQTVANIDNTVEGNRLIIQAARDFANRSIERANFYTKWLDHNKKAVITGKTPGESVTVDDAYEEYRKKKYGNVPLNSETSAPPPKADRGVKVGEPVATPNGEKWQKHSDGKWYKVE